MLNLSDFKSWTATITGRLSKTEAAALTDEFLIERANVVAVDENGYDVDITTVTNTIETEKGTYEVVFETDKGTSITVDAFVSEKVVVDPSKKEILSYNDFTLSVGDVTKNNDALLISLANAKAYDSVSGKAITISVSDKSALLAARGTHNVKFKTANNTAFSVNANVLDNGGSNPDTNIKEVIYANDFIIKSNAVAGLSIDSIKAFANAIAFNLADGSSVEITEVNYSDIEAVRGKYDVIFETAKGTQLTIKATVEQNSIVTDSEEMYSANFTLSEKAVTDLLVDGEINN